MNWFLRSVVLLMGICCCAAIVTAANDEKSTLAKRDIKPSSELEEIFADDTKRKRSQEVIMFGNQQNKPAGMVDDGLIRFAEKKSDKGDDEDEEDHGDDNDEIEEDDEGSDQDSGSSEVLPSKINVTRNLNSNPPIVAEMGSDDSDATDDIRTDDKSRHSGFAEDEQDDSDLYLPKNLLPPRRSDISEEEEEDQEEEEEDSRKSELNPRYVSRLNDYNNRYYNGDVVYRRNIRKRSLLTPLDKLMNSNPGARWKRDVRLSKGDVVGLLGILAAAEKAKERQAARQHNLADLESAYLDSLTEIRPSDSDEFEEFANVGDNNDYGPIRYEGPDDEVVSEEVPDWAVYEPESNLDVRRRSLSGPFYPPVDYRALGVIGNRKRSSPRRSNLWGRFEERKRFFQREPDPNYFEGEEEDQSDGTGRDEELYTLGELLNGNDVEDTRYPVYRRLI